MAKKTLSEAVLKRVSDADFDIVMKSVNFKTTPRDVITVGKMEEVYNKTRGGEEWQRF